MTEKRVFIAAALSAVFLAAYSLAMTKSPFGPQMSKSIAPLVSVDLEKTQAQRDQPTEAIRKIVKEDTVTIESQALSLEIGTSTGAVRKVTLKNFTDESKKQPLTIESQLPLVQLQLNEREPIAWHLSSTSPASATLESNESSLRLGYSLSEKPEYVFVISFDQLGPIEQEEAPTIITSWRTSEASASRDNRLELVSFENQKNGRQAYRKFIGPWKTERIVPRGTTMISLAERYFCEVVKADNGFLSATLIPTSPETIAAKLSINQSEQPEGSVTRYKAEVYIGPRDYFYLKRSKFEDAFPLGILGKIGLALLVVLTWIAAITKSYGAAIIIFSVLVTSLMAPFTLTGMKSMKRMQELKPKIDKIMSQHKGDSVSANKEVFALYKEHKVSPLGGCLPLLLQMPIFLALFQAISHFVELRGKPFLWIDDLSLPDRLFQLPVSLPILGKDLNVLPIIMAAAMYAQTRLTQQASGSDASASTRIMSGPLMSVLFGVMFYQVPSGLVLYWLTNSLISVCWYQLAKSSANQS